MSEHPTTPRDPADLGSSETPAHDPHLDLGSAAPDYDPTADTDSDPSTLNPRRGRAAKDMGDTDEDDDTDADPDNLNPRDLRPGHEEDGAL